MYLNDTLDSDEAPDWLNETMTLQRYLMNKLTILLSGNIHSNHIFLKFISL